MALDAFRSELRNATRRALQSPVQTVFIVLSLGVGMAGVVATLGLLDTLLLRPPPGVKSPGQVVAIGRWSNFSKTTYPDYLDFQTAGSLASCGAFAAFTYTPRVGNRVTVANALLASHTLLQVLEEHVSSGRWFSTDDDQPGAAGVALVTTAFWDRTAGRGVPALGTSMVIAGSSYTIIGILPSTFTAPDLGPVDIILPITNAPWLGGREGLSSRRYRWLRVVARLRTGVGRSAAQSEITEIYRRANRGDESIDQGTLAHEEVPVEPIVTARQEPTAPTTRVATWTALLAIVVLIIACANAASMLLAQGIRNRRSLALHSALGATPRRLALRALTEVALLVAGAIAVCIPAEYFISRELVRRLLTGAVPLFTVDYRTAILVTVTAVLVTVVCALLPLARNARVDPRAELAMGSQAVTNRHRLVLRALVVLQASLCFLLLAEGAVFVISLRNALHTALGIDPKHLVIADADLQTAGVRPDQVAATVSRMLEGISAVRGVSSVGVTNASAVPGFLTFPVVVPGADTAGGGPTVSVNAVTAGYFDALGLKKLVGRLIEASDVLGGRAVAVITRDFEDHYWGHTSAIGRCISLGDASAPCGEVVGVVDNRRRGPNDLSADIEVYVPLGSKLLPQALSAVFPGREVAVRINGDEGQVTEFIRTALLEAVPGLSSVRIRTGFDYFDRQFRPWRLGAAVLGTLGIGALALSMVGVFGVFSFVVAQRSRELGIRHALGARRSHLAKIVISEAVVVSAAGVLLGSLAAMLAARVTRSLMFGVSPLDLRVFLGVALTLTIATIAAAVRPAAQAARANSVDLIRNT